MDQALLGRAAIGHKRERERKKEVLFQKTKEKTKSGIESMEQK